MSCPPNYLWIFICNLSRYTDLKCSLSHTHILTSPNPESQVVTFRMHFSIYVSITYKNATIHACQPVPFQLMPFIVPTTTQSIPCLCFPNQTQKQLGDNATFQIARFWHCTESQHLNQVLPQRRGHGLPFHRAQDDVKSREGGTFHTETQQGSGTEGQIVQQPHRMMKKAGDVQAEELLCCTSLCKPCFFFTSISLCSSACHWLPYLFLYPSLPYSVLSPTAFILYCSYSHSFPIKFTLLCQSSSWKQHFCCCFHSLLLAPVSPPCPVSSSSRVPECLWGRDRLELRSPSPCATWPPCLLILF